MKTAFVTVTDTGIEVCDLNDSAIFPPVIVRDIGAFNRALEASGFDNFVCSSTVDFPQEYTDDAAVLALVGEIVALCE